MHGAEHDPHAQGLGVPPTGQSASAGAQEEVASEPHADFTAPPMLQSRSLNRSFGLRSRNEDTEEQQDDLSALRSRSASVAADRAVAEFDAGAAGTASQPAAGPDEQDELPERPPVLAASRSLNRSFGQKTRFVDDDNGGEDDLHARLGLAAGEQIVEVDDASMEPAGDADGGQGGHDDQPNYKEVYRRAESKVRAAAPRHLPGVPCAW